MTAAGFDPKGAIAFLKTLDQERALNPVDVPAYIMSHPITQERVANAELVVKSLGSDQTRAEKPENLQKIKTIIRMDRPDRDKVVAELEKSARQHPASAEHLHLLGFAHHLQGNLPEARRNLEKARQIRPDHAALQRDLGRLYGDTEDFASARQAFDRALVLEPGEPLTYFYLGEMLEKSGDLKTAAGAFLNAHNLAPLWERPPQKLGMVYGRLDRRGDGYYYLGKAFQLLDDDARAIADYERALKIIGENSPRGQLIKGEIAILRSRRR